MARLTAVLQLAVGAANAVLTTYASIVFSRSRVVGSLLLAATATEPRAFLYGVLGVGLALGASRALGLDADAAGHGPVGYNALLVALGVAHALQPGAASIALLVGGVLTTVLVGSCLASLWGSLPTLSFPFVGVYWVVLAAAPLAGASLSTVAPDHPSNAALAILQGVGNLFFLPRAGAGALIVLALLWHSRIATLLAAAGGAAAYLVAPSGAVAAAGLNGALAAVAVGGVWFVPSAASLGLGLVASLLASLMTLGFSPGLERLGLPTLILPFNLAVVVILLAARRRTADRSPKSVDFVPGSPEENLDYYRTHVERFRILYGVRFHLPFRGAWECTQGVDGALTHQAEWRHAFDFEVRGEDGAFHRADGTRVEDFHCHRLPVLATADGTVVKVVGDVPDNAVGHLELRRNWGNLVVLRHAPGLFSVVAHLAMGSIRVQEGQFVKSGDLLGLCGSSGRSPKPHLHFQLQGAPEIGAATLPCAFGDVVVRRGDAEEVLIASVPLQGETVRNVAVDRAIADFFSAPPGTALELRVGESIEVIEQALDLLGQEVFRSKTTGASLVFSRGERAFTTYHPLGERRSALQLLRAALPRVPFDAAHGLEWCDVIPHGPWGSMWSKAFDLTAAFRRDGAIRMRYRMRVDGDTLVVAGASLKRRGSDPVVETRATLSRRRGLTAIEVRAGRILRVAKEVSASEGKPSEVPAATPLLYTLRGDCR